MQLIDNSEFPRLRGQEAIKALYDLVDELEEHRGEELTDKQTKALIKFARGLISSIEAEKRSSISDENIRETCFVGQLKETITQYISESISKALRFV